jgi:hypothetical protein
MDVDRYPTGSRVDVYWCDVEEWYAATVLKTRTVSHTIAGAKTLCREILCFYDYDGEILWHSLHNRDVRACTTQPPADESGIAEPFPTGTSVDVWWTGDKCFYSATVLTTRTAWNNIKRMRTLCREIYCDYELDGHMQWHSLHNNKVRIAPDKSAGAEHPNRATPKIAP